MIKMINKLKNRKGFTLIELIVVLAVLAIIMAIAVPRFMGVQKQAKVDADVATLGLIAKTSEFYYAKGNVDAKYTTSPGAVISGTDDLTKGLSDDFKDGDLLQSVDNSQGLSSINLYIDANGKAQASYGTTLKSK